MSHRTAPARILSAIAAAALGIAGLAGCTLVTTLASGDEPEPTSTEAQEPEHTSEGESPEPTDDTESSETPTEEGQLTNFFDLKVGDCFDEPNGGGGDALLYSSCDVPHTYEAYSVVIMEGEATYPGDDAVAEFAANACLESFQGYVGSNPNSSSFTYEYIVPSESTWENMNDREIMCLVTPKDGSPTTGSAQNSRL